MPHKCCVATCRGNYRNGPKVAVFRFPKEAELREKWMLSLKRKDGFTPTTYSRVCELHFQPQEILREAEMFDCKTGKLIKAPIANPRLKPGSIPSQFPDGPSYLSSASTSRESPNKKRLRREMEAIDQAIEASINEKQNYDCNRTFTNLSELKSCLERESLTDFWTVIHTATNVMFLNIHFDPAPNIQMSLLIDSELNVSSYVKKVPLTSVSKFIFPLKINNINVLLNILSKLESISCPSESDEKLLDLLCILNELLTEVKILIPTKESEINFLSEQITKLNSDKNQYRYSAELLIFCSLFYSISPHAYKFLRSSGIIVMPHPHTIHRVCSKFCMNPVNEQFNDNFLGYIKQKYQELEERERSVVLMMDEVHLKPCFDFKGGNLCGMAYNCENAATSAYVFMIRSLLSSFKDVAHILPVKTLSADDLYHYIRKIIIGLESIGFKTVAVVSDNNSINKKAMSMFSTPPKVSIVYKNPVDLSRPLFFVIDSVHILKSIRNNWINQKNGGQYMFYPNFENCSLVESASFAEIKKLHEIESCKLVKYGYGLTLKALFPTNLERQNVKLALQIFDICVAEALMVVGKEKHLSNYEATAGYIKIICTWWSIVNVKTIFKGDHKNDDFQKPLTIQADDVKFVYLHRLIDWLDEWKSMRCTTGGLTKETHFALTHTTYALIEMARYCIEELKFDYFLPGKVQTDLLESRFGKYRQLAGWQHNISIRQVYETEAKLRLQSFLPCMVKSAKYGEIPIHLSLDHDNWKDVGLLNENNIQKFSGKIVIEENDINAINLEMPVLTYIAGYCCYGVLKKLNCDICKGNLTVDKQLIAENDNLHSWIKTFDRGLLYPHPDVLNAVVYTFIVVQKLVSKEFENEFLSSTNQRYIVCNLTLNLLGENLFFLDLEGCQKEHESQKVLMYILRSSSNIFLSNYCKKRNGLLCEKKHCKVA